MSEEKREKANSADDIHVTVAQSSATGEWEMPEPVFRQTSGYLPQGFQKQFEQPDPAPEPEVRSVEPQPDISDILAAEPPVVLRSVPARSSTGPLLRIVLILAGLAAVTAVLAVFTAIVYYLFLAAPADTNF